MHITITAIGSHGDVQPCVALGLGLKQAGYQVRIVAYGVFADFVEQWGLEFAPVTGDPRESMEQKEGQAWLESGDNPVDFARGLNEMSTKEVLRQVFTDIEKACMGTDLIIYSMFGAAAYHVAEKMGIPKIYVLLQPFTRSREVPSIVSLGRNFGRWGNWMTHVVGEQIVWQMARSEINNWRRKDLGLAPIPFWGPFKKIYQEHHPYLYGFSEHVFSRPADWPVEHEITGYWFLPEEKSWEPPEALELFLSAGSKPVYIGFGSMSGRIAQRLVSSVIKAVELSKQRAVLLGGWANLYSEHLPDTIFSIKSVPHSWLFPRMAAVVHHGGAGTTAAGIRAGVPSVIVPFFADQPFWGWRVEQLGVGPKMILNRNLTAENLAAAISEAVFNPDMRQRAAQLGEKIRAEDGVARAVASIELALGKA